jgi:hypothetical protein
MKKIISILCIACCAAINLQAQCDTLTLSYKKVMNNFEARKYTKCPVIIVAEFLKHGLPKNVNEPGRMGIFRAYKNVLYFQCVNPGDDGKAMPKTGEIAGEFFMINKRHADVIAKLKQGDKITIIGNTLLQSPQDLSMQYSRGGYVREKYDNEEYAKFRDRVKLFFIIRGIKVESL